MKDIGEDIGKGGGGGGEGRYLVSCAIRAEKLCSLLEAVTGSHQETYEGEVSVFAYQYLCCTYLESSQSYKLTISTVYQ